MAHSGESRCFNDKDAAVAARLQTRFFVLGTGEDPCYKLHGAIFFERRGRRLCEGGDRRGPTASPGVLPCFELGRLVLDYGS